ncbi:acyl-CoA dehydrogenase family protein [Nitrosospira sp. Nsp13]|jgi:acyl-CoA dehydrogenase|uniref:acyl-CoA dehydrogenase family protein n=1 Tax=Nitrosospira sp. Nsp13 TaxID=1855332 RepID=UPI0008921A91|nr:acyl-CoA dehydrogenase family protein [Nitrosospira sp. Nsp13]SCY04021.1 acyl-CoA dehydrogenase [Nitrosospira sp. Nsp13]
MGTLMPEIHEKSAHTELARVLASEVRKFVDEMIIPNESRLAQEGNASFRLQSELAEKARYAGLWGLFYPLSHGGRIASLEDYLIVAEQEGHSEFSPAILGSHSALDAHMLLKFGTDEIRQNFLQPMVAGKAIPSYGMTEPEHGGSFPALITTSAYLSNGNWTINGRKWFVGNTDRATFVTVLARTAEENIAPGKALSMIVVPADSPGFRVERQITVMDRSLGQGEISFSEVRVPSHNLLGTRGSGIDLMSWRLGMGRLLRSMNWVGLAQRCFDLMGARINSDRGRSARLPEKQLVRQHVAKAYQAIASARALIRVAARGVDARRSNDIEINIAKIAASQALCIASDSAIQLYGAEGISDLTPLSGIYRIARTSRILDGSDESLISSVGRRLINFYKEEDVYYFD